MCVFGRGWEWREWWRARAERQRGSPCKKNKSAWETARRMPPCHQPSSSSLIITSAHPDLASGRPQRLRVGLRERRSGDGANAAAVVGRRRCRRGSEGGAQRGDRRADFRGRLLAQPASARPRTRLCRDLLDGILQRDQRLRAIHLHIDEKTLACSVPPRRKNSRSTRVRG